MDQLARHARGERVFTLEQGEDGPVFETDSFDFIALERRRAVSEASLSLGLFGQRVIRAATAEGSKDTELDALTLRIVARLVEVVCAPEPAAEVNSYLWENTARNNAGATRPPNTPCATLLGTR
jgi:hypothetical protein